MPVLLLAGDEEFELGRRVEKLRAELVDKQWETFNFKKISNPEIREVIDLAGSVPFGPGKLMILMDRCELFAKKRGKGDSEKAGASEKAVKQLLDDFDKALAMVAPETYLVFACSSKLDPTLRTSKVVGKHAKIESFEKPKYYGGAPSSQLISWCQREAKRFGATIDDAAITYLFESTEANFRQISKELEKAAVFILPKTHIGLADVSSLSSHYSHIFSLLDHWVSGRSGEALRSLDELISRQSGLPIIATMQTTLAKWIELKAKTAHVYSQMPSGRGIQRRELSINDLADRIAAHPSVKFMVLQDLKRSKDLTLRRLSEKRAQLCELERKVKSGLMSDQHALVVFLST
jgi:DNA polymerase III delta subunit